MNFISKLKNAFTSFSKFLLLAILCVLTTVIVSWPLWKLATTNSKIYSIIVISLLIAYFVFLIIKKIVNRKKHE